jgi:hypothetical protein
VKCRDDYWNAARCTSVKRGEWRKRRYGNPVKIEATQNDLAYVAGFTDGEGHIGVVREVRRGNTSGFRYKLLVEIANTNRESLERISARLGGIGFIGGARNDHKFPNAKPLYKLRFSGQEARSLVPALMPYLFIKRKVAELALEFFRRVDELPMRASRDHEALDELWRETHRLNKRGVRQDDCEHGES